MEGKFRGATGARLDFLREGPEVHVPGVKPCPQHPPDPLGTPGPLGSPGDGPGSQG